MIFKFFAIILECCLVICILIFWFGDFFGFCIVIVECLFFVVIHFAIHIFLEIYVLYFCVEVKLFNILNFV